MPRPSADGAGGVGGHGVGGFGGDINIHIDINLNIDIQIIINMNIEYYIAYYTLLMSNFQPKSTYKQQTMNFTIHKWVCNAIAVPNPTQYTKLGKYMIKTKTKQLVQQIQNNVNIWIHLY